MIFNYILIVSNLVFYKFMQFGLIGVKMYWLYLDIGIGGGIFYCNIFGRVNSGLIIIENVMVYLGKDYGGYKLFNIFVSGLYYIMLILRVWFVYDIIIDI